MDYHFVCADFLLDYEERKNFLLPLKNFNGSC